MSQAQSLSLPEISTSDHTSDEFEEFDLESTAGRELLMQEIEDLVLTDGVVTNDGTFVDVDVYRLVVEIQDVFTDIEQTIATGEEILQAQVEQLQDLYNQLVTSVEDLVAVSNRYVGPSRKDLTLVDLGEVGDVTITQAASETSRALPRTIHNSLPIKNRTPQAEVQTSKNTTQTVAPAAHSQLPARQTDLYKPDTREVAHQKIIDAIEASELSLLDAWINDYQSPYKVLGSMQFADLQRMSAASINSRQYVEFKKILSTKNVKYEVFNQWQQQFSEMQIAVDGAEHKTFKQVVDAYIPFITES